MKNLELRRIVYKRMTDLQRTMDNLTITFSCTRARGEELEESVCDAEKTLALRQSLHGRHVEYLAKVETSLQDFSTQIERSKTPIAYS